MSDLQRMRSLAGILTEGVMAVPGVGNGSESGMQTAATANNGADAAAFDASQPQVTEMDPMAADQGAEMVAPEQGAIDPSVIEGYCAALNILLASYVEPAEAVEKIVNEMREYGHDENEIECILSAIDEYFKNDSMGSGPETNTMEGEPVPMPTRDAERLRQKSEEEKWRRHREDDARQRQQPAPAEMAEAYDLNNGYGDEHEVHPSNYFPDGADGPVVAKTGPSGARQGDNPEQKKMAVAETHKELVYNYRNFLKEAVALNELNKDTLKSYAKKRGNDVRADQRDAEKARKTSSEKSSHGDSKGAAEWDDEGKWLDKRAEKGAGKVANAVIKAAKK